jgi:hypothetical protein|tara:strand:+ start:33 stop:230 length:198 start_codon:yes stop_codon:yes gene_type:complete
MSDGRANVLFVVFDEGLHGVRYAIRGFFDGTTKYARYYGIGGGVGRDGIRAVDDNGVDVKAAFDE